MQQNQRRKRNEEEKKNGIPFWRALFRMVDEDGPERAELEETVLRAARPAACVPDAAWRSAEQGGGVDADVPGGVPGDARQEVLLLAVDEQAHLLPGGRQRPGDGRVDAAPLLHAGPPQPLPRLQLPLSPRPPLEPSPPLPPRPGPPLPCSPPSSRPHSCSFHHFSPFFFNKKRILIINSHSSGSLFDLSLNLQLVLDSLGVALFFVQHFRIERFSRALFPRTLRPVLFLRLLQRRRALVGRIATAIRSGRAVGRAEEGRSRACPP